jgi:SpoU rRNA methylase family enzyme
MDELYVCIHNVASVQKLIDFSKVVYSFSPPIKALIMSKVGGTAAQAGIPEVMKLSYKLGKSALVLPDLKDVIELVNPDKIFLISSFASNGIDMNDLKEAKRLLIVFNGIENDFPKTEQALGDYVSLPYIKGDIGPTGMAVAFIYSSILSGVIKIDH